MNEVEIRAQLEKTLRAPFSNTTWKRFRRSKGFEEYCERLLSWEDLTELAEEEQNYERNLLAEAAATRGTSGIGLLGGSTTENWDEAEGHTASKGEQNKHQGTDLKPPELSPEERLRAEVFEEYLANVASIDKGYEVDGGHKEFMARVWSVRIFRQWILGGQLLTSKQALQLVRSPAAQAFEHYRFIDWNIPVIGHTATLERYERDVPEDKFNCDRATISVDPPGITESVLSPWSRDKRFRMLHFVNENGYADQMRVWSTSILGALSEITEHLVRKFPWQEAQATWWVLTGKVPAVPPVTVRYKLKSEFLTEDNDFEYGEVTLTVAPWVSAETVNNVYRDIQRRILKGDRNRQPELKNLTLLRFVAKKEDVANLSRARRREQGRELMTEWDNENPHWAYGKRSQRTSTFWRDYNDIEEAVIRPGYRDPRKATTDKA